ncbi:MAG: exodeoxyribonuclease VII large subunit [Muribaculaceae bacterium]|nr:exodeoxyribonuclease VII large subunit [Muribaculaceae bacterium]
MEAMNRQSGPTIYTLSKFSSYVAAAMSREPVLMGAWVTAEISDLSSRGVHCYMTLLEIYSRVITIGRI